MEGFNKFRKKMLIEALLKSALISYSIGAICFAVPYLIMYFMKIDFGLTNTMILLISCISGASILFGLLLLILYPTKIKAARRLDKELALNQKVQTMIEFKDSDTQMAKLQRIDAQNILQNTNLKKLSMRFGVFLFVLLGLSVVLTAGVVVAAAYEEPVIDEPGYTPPAYDLDNWTVRALLDLIEVVDKSQIDSELKTPVVYNLTVLLTSLEDVEYVTEMEELVLEVIDDTELRLNLINSNNEVFTELKGSDTPIVRDLVTQINALNVTNVNNCIENFYIYLCGDPSTTTQAISDLDASFRYLIEKSKLQKEEKLTKALLKFATELSNSNNADDVSTVINNNKDAIVDIIKTQTENKRIIEYTVTQLRIIFGLNETEPDENPGDGTSNPTINPVEPPKLNPDEVQGGYGSGDVLFGSDDVIFDIEKGSVEYGEVIAKYYGDLIGMFNDGTIPEEYRELFDKYFDSLFGFYEEEE